MLKVSRLKPSSVCASPAMLFAYSFINVVSLFILLIVTEQNFAQNKKNTTVYEDALKHFDELLSTIANMNKKRLDALKQYAELDSYGTYGILRKVKNTKNYKMAALTKNVTKSKSYKSLLEIITKSMIYNRLLEVICKEDGKSTNHKYAISKKIHDVICKNQPKLPQIARHSDHLHRNYRHNKFKSEPAHFNENTAKSNVASTIEIKKIKTPNEYISSEKYKVMQLLIGDAIFEEIEEWDNYDQDEIILVNDGITKIIIYDILHEIICKDGWISEQDTYKDTILKSGISQRNEMLMLNHENITNIVKEVLSEMICKKGSGKILKSKSSVPAWLRSSNHVDKSNPVKHSRNIYSYEDISKFSRKNGPNNDDSSRNDIFFDNNNDPNNDHADDNKDRNKNVIDDDIGAKVSALVLRENCRKHTNSKCEEACKDAVDDVCDKHECIKSMRKSFKEKCYINCEACFGNCHNDD